VGGELHNRGCAGLTGNHHFLLLASIIAKELPTE
jgi:hypothetical protein